jgi:hypothetical protein
VLKIKPARIEVGGGQKDQTLMETPTSLFL